MPHWSLTLRARFTGTTSGCHPLIRRRRLKELKEPAYTVEESRTAAGLGVDNKQRGVEEVVKRLEGMDGIAE
jgi:hypothetical protein